MAQGEVWIYIKTEIVACVLLLPLAFSPWSVQEQGYQCYNGWDLSCKEIAAFLINYLICVGGWGWDTEFLSSVLALGNYFVLLVFQRPQKSLGKLAPVLTSPHQPEIKMMLRAPGPAQGLSPTPQELRWLLLDFQGIMYIKMH